VYFGSVFHYSFIYIAVDIAHGFKLPTGLIKDKDRLHPDVPAVDFQDLFFSIAKRGMVFANWPYEVAMITDIKDLKKDLGMLTNFLKSVRRALYAQSSLVDEKYRLKLWCVCGESKSSLHSSQLSR
jgi:hypothetical protein